jgi:palmitoyltransferase
MAPATADPSVVELALRDSGSDSDSDDEEEEEEDGQFVLDVEPLELADAQLANVDPAHVPLRAKYCRNSRRYVATFDHFCGVLGTPIGERNHWRFWLFLAVHALGLSLLIHQVASGFRDTRAELTTWVAANGHALAASLWLALLQLAVGTLLIFHSFLAASGMTSYEFMRADKVGYLEGTRDFDLPFSRGLSGNLRRFCLADGLAPALRWLTSGASCYCCALKRRPLEQPLGEQVLELLLTSRQHHRASRQRRRGAPHTPLARQGRQGRVAGRGRQE